MAASDVSAPAVVGSSRKKRKNSTITRLYTAKSYPLWFLVPSVALFVVFFVVPSVASFYFAFTRWDFQESTWIGWANFQQFFAEPQLKDGLVHTMIYAVVTSGSKVVLGLPLAVLLTSNIIGRGFVRSIIFFPVLASTIGVGIAFKALMDPTSGVINQVLHTLGIPGPGWLTDPGLVLYSIAIVDIWKGVGLATLIYMAGILAIPRDYYEAASVDGTSKFKQFLHITLPLAWPATTTVITLSLIGGLRSFDLIWAMTRGGPGFASDVIASVIYKQYQAGFYGLSTAGNVVLFLLVAVIVMPLQWLLTRREVEL